MIKLAIRKVKPDQEGHPRAWMAELNRRSAEVLETFAQEGVRHEQAYLLKTAEGAVLIYSALPIDHEHKRVMAQVLEESANAELLYECTAEDDAC
jgi:uncharacterized protein DUF6176